LRHATTNIMPDSKTPTPPGAPANGRVFGWKDIASHLDRGVRTVQRWERELGLPIHRLDTGSAETVFAFREELDAWLATREAPTGSGVDDNVAVGSAALSRTDDAAAMPTTRRRAEDATSSPAGAGRTLRWLAAAGLLTVIGIASWERLVHDASGTPTATGAHASPVAVEIAGDTLTALGPGGQRLWDHKFDGPLRSLTGPGAVKDAIAVRDVDGDGHNEVVVTNLPPDNLFAACFNHEGRLRFQLHSIGTKVRFGPYKCPPTVITGVFVEQQARIPGTFFLIGHHTSFFPAVLQLMDARGRVYSEYWSNGFIGAVAGFDFGGRYLTLVGAANNETKGASLAVFDGEVAGSAPAVKPDYRCAGCPEGGPARFIVFPRSRLQAETDQGAIIQRIHRVSDDEIGVDVIVGDGVAQGAGNGIAYYILDRDFRIVHAEIGSGFAGLQRQFEAAGRVTPSTRYRGDEDMFPVRRWNGRGYDLIGKPETK
jgi:hypothetical protein